MRDLLSWLPVGFRSAGDALIVLCAAALVATSVVHSIIGERRLIGPLLAQRGGVLDRDLARFLLRAVWHFMTVLFWILAIALCAVAGSTDRLGGVLLAAIALGIGGAGILDAIGSRGRHVGWPMLVLIGLLAGLAVAVRA